MLYRVKSSINSFQNVVIPSQYLHVILTSVASCIGVLRLSKCRVELRHHSLDGCRPVGSSALTLRYGGE